jgi:hypothetical protein
MPSPLQSGHGCCFGFLLATCRSFASGLHGGEFRRLLLNEGVHSRHRNIDVDLVALAHHGNQRLAADLVHGLLASVVKRIDASVDFFV